MQDFQTNLVLDRPLGIVIVSQYFSVKQEGFGEEHHARILFYDDLIFDDLMRLFHLLSLDDVQMFVVSLLEVFSDHRDMVQLAACIVDQRYSNKTFGQRIVVEDIKLHLAVASSDHLDSIPCALWTEHSVKQAVLSLFYFLWEECFESLLQFANALTTNSEIVQSGFLNETLLAYSFDVLHAFKSYQQAMRHLHQRGSQVFEEDVDIMMRFHDACKALTSPLAISELIFIYNQETKYDISVVVKEQRIVKRLDAIWGSLIDKHLVTALMADANNQSRLSGFRMHNLLDVKEIPFF